MAPWPADNEEFGERGGDNAPRPNSNHAAFAQQQQQGGRPFSSTNEETFLQRPYPPAIAQQNSPSSHWLRQQQSPYGDRRGSFGGGAPVIAPYELAMIQAQRQAMEAEQSNLQRMSQSFVRRRSSMSDPYIETSKMASERLKKRRRISVPTTILFNKRGNSFPMPPVVGGGNKIRINSMDTFQRAWDEHVTRSENLFPEDADKQMEYVKCRFMSALRGGCISFSVAARGKSDS